MTGDTDESNDVRKAGHSECPAKYLALQAAFLGVSSQSALAREDFHAVFRRVDATLAKIAAECLAGRLAREDILTVVADAILRLRRRLIRSPEIGDADSVRTGFSSDVENAYCAHCRGRTDAAPNSMSRPQGDEDSATEHAYADLSQAALLLRSFCLSLRSSAAMAALDHAFAAAVHCLLNEANGRLRGKRAEHSWLEDVSIEAIMKFRSRLQSLEPFKKGALAVQPYFKTVVDSALIDYVRKLKRHRRGDDVGRRVAPTVTPAVDSDADTGGLRDEDELLRELKPDVFNELSDLLATRRPSRAANLGTDGSDNNEQLTKPNTHNKNIQRKKDELVAFVLASRDVRLSTNQALTEDRNTLNLFLLRTPEFAELCTGVLAGERVKVQDLASHPDLPRRMRELAVGLSSLAEAQKSQRLKAAARYLAERFPPPRKRTRSPTRAP